MSTCIYTYTDITGRIDPNSFSSTTALFLVCNDAVHEAWSRKDQTVEGGGKRIGESFHFEFQFQFDHLDLSSCRLFTESTWTSPRTSRTTASWSWLHVTGFKRSAAYDILKQGRRTNFPKAGFSNMALIEFQPLMVLFISGAIEFCICGCAPEERLEWGHGTPG